MGLYIYTMSKGYRDHFQNSTNNLKELYKLFPRHPIKSHTMLKFNKYLYK